MLIGRSVTQYLQIAGRYASPILLVLTALFLSLALRASFGNPAWFFFPAAVVAATWIGGRGPGWVAVIVRAYCARRFRRCVKAAQFPYRVCMEA
jgi:hypothetical protein